MAPAERRVARSGSAWPPGAVFAGPKLFFLADMGQHPGVDCFAGVQAHGRADVFSGFVVCAHGAEDAGQVEMGVVVLRREFQNPFAETQGQINLLH